MCQSSAALRWWWCVDTSAGCNSSSGAAYVAHVAEGLELVARGVDVRVEPREAGDDLADRGLAVVSPVSVLRIHRRRTTRSVLADEVVEGVFEGADGRRRMLSVVEVATVLVERSFERGGVGSHAVGARLVQRKPLVQRQNARQQARAAKSREVLDRELSRLGVRREGRRAGQVVNGRDPAAPLLLLLLPPGLDARDDEALGRRLAGDGEIGEGEVVEGGDFDGDGLVHEKEGVSLRMVQTSRVAPLVLPDELARRRARQREHHCARGGSGPEDAEEPQRLLVIIADLDEKVRTAVLLVVPLLFDEEDGRRELLPPAPSSFRRRHLLLLRCRRRLDHHGLRRRRPQHRQWSHRLTYE